jgi:prevent-host-death family protein
MTTMTASKARAQFFKIMDQTAEYHEPIQITGKRSNAVLISEEDWRSMQETLYLLSVPGMREKILKASRTPRSKMLKKLPW